MARWKLPWGTAATLATYLAQQREIFFDTTNNRPRVGDGSTTGGKPLAFKSEVDTLPTGSDASLANVTATGPVTKTLAQWMALIVNLGSTAISAALAPFIQAATKLEAWLLFGAAPSVKLFGAVGDLRVVFDAAITSGDATLTSATMNATAADIGKYVNVQGAGAVHLFSIRKPLVATIVSINSPTSVELSANASVTVTGKECGIGTDDSAAFQAAIASGHKRVLALGQYMWATTVTFPADCFHFQGSGGLIDKQSLNYGNGSTETTGMDAALTKVGTRIMWAGAFGSPMALFAPSSALGFERKHFGNGVRDILFDCAGATCTGVAVRGQQSMEFWNVSVVRFMRNIAANTQYTTSQYDAAWDIASSYGSSFTYWDMRGFRGRIFAVNRGSPYAGAVGLWAHGDKIKGNVNYMDIEGEILIENDGNAVAMHIESVDTSDFSRFRWNAQGIFHAADTGFRSTLNGNTTAANNTTHPASQARTCHTSKGGYCVYKGTTYTDGVTAAKYFASRSHTALPSSEENIGVPPNVQTNAQVSIITEGTGTDTNGLLYGMGHPVTLLFKASQSLGSGSLGSPVTFTWSEAGIAYDDVDAFDSGASTTNIVVPDGYGFTRARVRVNMNWPTSDTDGNRRLYVRHDGAIIQYEERVALDGAEWGYGTYWFPVEPGDVIDVQGSQDSGSSLSLVSTRSYVEIEWR